MVLHYLAVNNLKSALRDSARVILHDCTTSPNSSNRKSHNEVVRPGFAGAMSNPTNSSSGRGGGRVRSVSTPTSRAGWLRGALVGSCSAVITVAAHAGAGGGMPRGSAFVIALLGCATIGAVTGSIPLHGRHTRIAGVILALGLAQALGHLTLFTAGGHHHGVAGAELTASMLAAHAAAAIVLGLVISSAEYLYVVCSSVLCWLRLFAAAVERPAHRTVRRVVSVVVIESVMLQAGLGMRAPPVRFAKTT